MERFFEVFPEWKLLEDQKRAVLRTRTAAIVGEDLARRFGWRIGDRVPLTSFIWKRKDGSPTWEFDIVGIYRIDRDALPASELIFHYAYFDESRAFGNASVSQYTALLQPGASPTAVSERIDALFRNSADETETVSEQQWMRSRLNQIGNIKFIVRAVLGAVLFTLLIVTGNTMIQSVRERSTELAVLQAIGYRRRTLALVTVWEAVLLCLGAALIGLLIAALVFPGIYRGLGVGTVPLRPSVMATGVLTALILAASSALIPVWRSARTNVAATLARN
jgi:putative ABC transport system permease protein